MADKWRLNRVHGQHCNCRACFEEWADATGFNQLRRNEDGSKGAQEVWPDNPAPSFAEDK